MSMAKNATSNRACRQQVCIQAGSPVLVGTFNIWAVTHNPLIYKAAYVFAVTYLYTKSNPVYSDVYTQQNIFTLLVSVYAANWHMRGCGICMGCCKYGM